MVAQCYLSQLDNSKHAGEKKKGSGYDPNILPHTKDETIILLNVHI